VSEQQEEKLDFFDKVELGLKLFGLGLMSIPIIFFTLAWMKISVVVGYLMLSAVFSS
jgi:hypothetical protein